MFLIVFFVSITLTTNLLVIVSFAPKVIDHATISFSSEIIASPSAETNSVPAGTLSCIYVVPSISPVFSTVIVYSIKSPNSAASFSFSCICLSNLIISLDFFAVMMATFVSPPSSGLFVGSLLSSPFAIATFEIVPVVGTSAISPLSVSTNISLFTCTVNLAITVFPAGTVTFHFTPSTVFSFTTVVFVPTLSPSTVASSIDTNVVFSGILSVISISFTSSSLLFVTAIT